MIELSVALRASQELYMAKRPVTRRRSSRRDDGDEEYAWEAKKKTSRNKKSTGSVKRSSSARAGKKKSSATNKTTGSAGSARGKKKSTRAAPARPKSGKLSKNSGSARSSSGRPASGKIASGKISSGKMASGKISKRSSTRQRSTRGEGLGDSGRRRRAAPAKKKGNPALTISMITIPLILVVGIVMINTVFHKEAIVQDDQKTLDGAQLLLRNGSEAYREWARAKNAGRPTKQLHGKALNMLKGGIEEMTTLLDQPPYKDPDGPGAKEDYAGYENELMEAAKLIVDLEKSSGL